MNQRTQCTSLNPSRSSLAVALCCGALISAGTSLADPVASAQSKAGPATLEQMRLATDKWIETQQIIFKERKEWQQGKEILLGRIELVEKEIGELEKKLKEVASVTAEANSKKQELVTEDEELKVAVAALAREVTGMEAEVRRMSVMLPEPTRKKLEPLYQRIPPDPAATKVAVAERFQNVLGILNEVNKANSEIFVNYEVRTLASGKPVEVQAIYIGLAQAYYVSAAGEAGICHPAAEGWNWVPQNSIGPDLQNVLNILQGKQTAAFVPLPVKIQ